MRKITLKDIAEHFRVSVATVSKALKDAPDIGEETRQKIKKYAKENSYKPNSIALSLLNKKTKTIGLVLPDILNYFFAKVLSGAEEIANQRGYKIITCITNESFQKEKATLDMLNGGSVDGIMISLTQETQQQESFDHLNEIVKNNTPLVMFDRVADEINCDKVVVNDIEGAILAVNHLLKTRCQKVGLVSTIYNSSVGKLRLEGYKIALKKAGINVKENYLIQTDEKKLEKAITPLLEKGIEAFLTLDEGATIETMQVLQKKGYRIPNEISIIGFASGAILKYITPNVTSISQHAKNMGRKAMDKLIDRIEKIAEENQFEKQIIKTTLIERESTRKM